jgi:predicted phosphoribosyltransferase
MRYRQIEIVCFTDRAGISPVTAVSAIDIAMHAPCRDFVAAVPGVPIDSSAVTRRFDSRVVHVYALFDPFASGSRLLLRHVGSHLVSLTIVTPSKYNRQAERRLNHE